MFFVRLTGLETVTRMKDVVSAAERHSQRQSSLSTNAPNSATLGVRTLQFLFICR